MSIVSYSEMALNAMSWAREAGAVHLRYFRGNELGVSTKGNDSDIVTAADKAAEQVLMANIHAAYPDHAILSEESGDDGRDSEFRWVIDPLDGTTNFSQGLPQFCVSIGLEHRGQRVVGVVFAPYLNELFHAVKGEGAYLNGNPLRVSGKSAISQSVVATGFPYDKDVHPVNNLDNVTRVMPLVRGLRILGSAAVDLCYVAAGMLDGYWEVNLHEWDVCAGLLVLEEAGGKWSYFRDDRNLSVLAATPDIYECLEPLIK